MLAPGRVDIALFPVESFGDDHGVGIKPVLKRKIASRMKVVRAAKLPIRMAARKLNRDVWKCRRPDFEWGVIGGLGFEWRELAIDAIDELVVSVPIPRDAFSKLIGLNGVGVEKEIG